MRDDFLHWYSRGTQTRRVYEHGLIDLEALLDLIVEAAHTHNVESMTAVMSAIAGETSNKLYTVKVNVRNKPIAANVACHLPMLRCLYEWGFTFCGVVKAVLDLRNGARVMGPDVYDKTLRFAVQHDPAGITALLSEPDLLRVFLDDPSTAQVDSDELFERATANPDAARSLSLLVERFGAPTTVEVLLKMCKDDWMLSMVADNIQKLLTAGTISHVYADFMCAIVRGGTADPLSDNRAKLLLAFGAHDVGSSWLTTVAAKAGALPALVWLRGRGTPWDSGVVSAAACTASLPCLRYLLETGCPWEESLLDDTVVQHGDCECTRYLYERGIRPANLMSRWGTEIPTPLLRELAINPDMLPRAQNRKDLRLVCRGWREALRGVPLPAPIRWSFCNNSDSCVGIVTSINTIGPGAIGSGITVTGDLIGNIDGPFIAY